MHLDCKVVSDYSDAWSGVLSCNDVAVLVEIEEEYVGEQTQWVMEIWRPPYRQGFRRPKSVHRGFSPDKETAFNEAKRIVREHLTKR